MAGIAREPAKQFIPLIGERSTFQSIVSLVGDAAVFEPAVVITNFDYRFRVAEQLAEIGAEATILLEPERRDSAAAVGAAAAWAAARDPKTIVAVFAADHVFADSRQFAKLCARASDAAAAGEIVTFGVTPDHPATGYGYIHPAAPLAIDPQVRRIEKFVEKPDEKRARAFIEDGYLWNSGNFIFRADVMLEELARFEPEIAAAATAAVALAKKDLGFVVLDRELFVKAPKISIDYAVMERTDKAAVLAADVGWSDVGEWSAVWRLSPRDGDGNSLRGRAVAIDSSNVLVRSDELLAAVIGLRDVVVIATGDAVLVADRSQTDKVKAAGRAPEGGGRARGHPASAHLSAVGLLSERRQGRTLPGQAHRRAARRPALPAKTLSPRGALGRRARRRRGDARRQG